MVVKLNKKNMLRTLSDEKSCAKCEIVQIITPQIFYAHFVASLPFYAHMTEQNVQSFRRRNRDTYSEEMLQEFDI